MENEELLIKFSMLEQQAQQIGQQLQIIEKNIIELQSLKLNLENLKNKKNSEILASIGRGIFIKAKLTSDELLVDVGGKNFVKKSIDETKKLIEKQIEKIEKIKLDLLEEMEDINIELIKIAQASESNKES